MNSQDSTTNPDTPIYSELANSELPWPNQQPVVDGVGDVSQDPDFVTDDVEEDQ